MKTKRLWVLFGVLMGALVLVSGALATATAAMPKSVIEGGEALLEFVPEMIAAELERAPSAETLQGRVYSGTVGLETAPLGGVVVSVYGSNNQPELGLFLISGTTDASGWYGLDAEDGFEYYRIVETDPDGYVSVGATTVSGTVLTDNVIEYLGPLAGKTLTGNKFWDKVPDPGWQKWVVGVLWDPTIQVTAQTSDTIVVVDVVAALPSESLDLVETWDPAHLKLVSYQVEPSVGSSVSASNDQLVWQIPEGNQVFTLTKWFHVEPCDWTDTTLWEELWKGTQELEQKNVPIQKTPPQLWINGQVANPQVYPGDVATFTLSYSNTGGYENGVTIKNYFPPEAPFAWSDPPADDWDNISGSWAMWIIGDLAANSEGAIVVGVGVEPSLIPSTVITITDTIFDHLVLPRGTTTITLHAQTPPSIEWFKWVNGLEWDPDLIISAQTSDTIEVVDVIRTPFPQDVELSEFWNPAELVLVDLIFEPPFLPAPVEGPGFIRWTVPSGSADVFTLTKIFRVEPCNWAFTVLEEFLSVDGSEPLARFAPIEKRLPELWINSLYQPDVLVGGPADFVLNYGNAGGYETNSWIRNEFPPEAPFAGSVPPPDDVSPDASWARWELGDLGTDETGRITVTVDIAAELPPSHTIPIWDWIFNHIDQPVDETITEFHIPPPPVTFPHGDWPWYAQDEIMVHPEPPIVGQPTHLCAEVVNHNPTQPHTVTLEFSVANFGIGAPFYPVGADQIVVPPASAAVGCIVWVPPTPQHWCIQVQIHGPRYPLMISQRNVDVDEPLQPYLPHTRYFPVGNPFDHPVTITLGLVPHLPDWGMELTQDVLPNMDPGEEQIVGLTVYPPAEMPPDGQPVVDVEAYAKDRLIGGFRKIFRPPIILHPFPDPPYAEREISVHPYPPRAGEPTEVCVELRNPTPDPHDVMVQFSWSHFGIGLPFTPINGPRPVHLPPHSIVRECIHWVPPISGEVCLQVELFMEGYHPQSSRLNLDVSEPLRPLEPHSRVFPVGNPFDHPVTITLGLIPHLPDWRLELSPDILLNIPSGETRPVTLTVTPPSDLPEDGQQIVDVEAYAGGNLIGGFRKIFRPSVPIHRPRDPVYAESEIGVDPYPVLPGQATELSVELFNPTNQNKIVTATFSIAPFGIGLPFNASHITPNPILIFVPAHGAARGHVIWQAPNWRGKFCVQVTIEIEGQVMWSRRNIDVGEPLRRGQSHSLDFRVGAWPHTEPVTVTLGLVNHRGWDISLSHDTLVNVRPGNPVTVTLTVTPSAEAELGAGGPIVDVEAFVNNELLGGFRKLDIPPIPLHKPHEKSYAESELLIVPYPPQQGRPTRVGAVLQNTGDQAATVDLEFGWAKFGMGIPFTTTGMLPYTRSVTLNPGMTTTSWVTWTPAQSGHQCVQVKLTDPGDAYNEQWSQRNVDVQERPPCGETKVFTFTVYNDSPFTVTVDVGLITFNVPTTWQVTVTPSPTVEIDPFGSEVITVMVSIPCSTSQEVLEAMRRIAQIQEQAGSIPTIDVEGYIDGNLVGGIELQFSPRYELYLPLVIKGVSG